MRILAGGKLEVQTRVPWGRIILGLLLFLGLATLAAQLPDLAAAAFVYLVLAAIALGLLAILIRYILSVIRRPFDLIVVHSAGVSIFNEMWYLLREGEARLVDHVTLAEIEGTTYRTSFWRSVLTLRLTDGKFIHMVQPLLFRRSPLPDADMDRLRAVGSVLSHAGVPMRYSLWKAILATIVATAIGAFGILMDFADMAPPESRRVAAAEPERRFALLRQVNVRASASGASPAVGQLPAGAQVSGTIIINPAGQPWLRIANGPLAGRYVWARNLTELGAPGRGEAATEPILNSLSPMPAPPPPPPLTVTSAWLTGGWVAQGEYCGVEGGERFNPGGRYIAYPLSGTWRLEGTRLTVTATLTTDEEGTVRTGSRRVERVGDDELIFHSDAGRSVRARRCRGVGVEPW